MPVFYECLLANPTSVFTSHCVNDLSTRFMKSGRYLLATARRKKKEISDHQTTIHKVAEGDVCWLPS